MTTVQDQLAAALATCREALADPKFAGLDGRLPGAPRDAAGWFALLEGYPETLASGAALARMKTAFPADAAAAGVKIEHYAALSALPAALSRIGDKPLPDSEKRFYASSCCEVAARERQWEGLYDLDDPEPFTDLAKFASLRSFPVGDVAFSFGKGAPLRWPLSIHPQALPGFLCELTLAMKGTDPTIIPHINYGRKTLVLQRSEYERSLWLMAKTIEMMPEVKGLSAVSWVHSSIVGAVFPHMAWMRDVFIDAGAYVVELEPSAPWRYGFGYKNPKRQKLYDEGKFCPRQTLILWPRNDFLEWAASHPELAPEGERPPLPPRRGLHLRIPPARASSQTKQNSPVRLWNGNDTYRRWGRLRYVAAIVLLPALAVSLMTAMLTYRWAALPVFLIALFVAHAFQYFFSQ
jgi:hypothetical protein